MSPSHSSSGGATSLRVTQTLGPHVPTRNSGRRIWSVSKSSVPSIPRALRMRPSSSNIQPWYGHWKALRVPVPMATGPPRCRQTLERARSVPSPSRHTTISSFATVAVKYWPGCSTWSVRPTHVQTSRNSVFISRSKSSRDVYQSFGRVPERSTP